jgi:hypothetical protein
MEIKSRSGSDCPPLACSTDETCCKAANSKHGCCPYFNGTCCKDLEHCCPSGFKCDDENQNCVPELKESVVAKMIRMSMIVNECRCPHGTTCCSLEDGDYGCCPYDHGTCCSDKLSCCPHDYRCVITQNEPTCTKGIMKMMKIKF